MANSEQLAILQRDIKMWNEWRKANRKFVPVLSWADLSGANVSQADLRRADLRGAKLIGADLSRAHLSDAKLFQANLSQADLSGARCANANFMEAALIRTKLEHADLTNARIYGISAWDLQLKDAVQQDLIITPSNAPNTITVDDLEVAQFIYLVLHNDRVRKVIDTVTSKVVLILGRFTPERKAVLDAVREELRKRNYLPIVFDFEKPSNRDLTETVSTLAHMAKFVIADLTDPRSLPQELATIVPHLRSVPVQPILLASEREWGNVHRSHSVPRGSAGRTLRNDRRAASEPRRTGDRTGGVLAGSGCRTVETRKKGF